MSQPLSVSAGSDRRTIGVILRSHGYVTDAQLADAAGIQARTGKPLGQVLVEAGAITRLELASALAEQWSDSSGWMNGADADTYSGSGADANVGIGATAVRRADDGLLATRLNAVEAALQDVLRSEPSTEPLEHAVADLARRITSLEPTLAELERRTDAAVDTDALESHLAELGATIETALGRSGVAAEAVLELDAKLDDLRAAVGQTREDADRASGETARELARLAEELRAARLEAPGKEPQVTAEDLAELRAKVAQHGDRVGLDAELRSRLEELAVRIDSLANRPAVGLDLADRVERIGKSVAVLADDSRLAKLQLTVSELAARPVEHELGERLEDLSRRVDALVVDAGARVGGEVPDELRTALEDLAARPPVDAALAARVEELAQRVAEFAAGQPRTDDALDVLVGELPNRIDVLADRLAELERDGGSRHLRETVEELVRRPAADPGLGDRLWRLAERVDELADTSAAQARDESAASDLAELRETVYALGSRAAADPETVELLGTRLEDLGRRVDELGRSLAAAAGESQDAPPELIAGLEARLDSITRELADVRANAARPLDTVALLADLDARLDARLAGHAGGGDSGAAELSAELSRTAELWYAGRAALEARLEQLEVRLEARVAERPVGPAAGASADAVPHIIEQEVERVLMAVERLGLHLSEHDRALAELMSRRGSSKVEELAARIDELETYGVASAGAVATPGADGAPQPVSMADTRDLRAELRSLSRQVTELEDTSRTDREKFLTQLERMASSIDWRIRRIESSESTP